MLAIKIFQKNVQKRSIVLRASKLFNTLRSINLIPENYDSMTKSEVETIVHHLKDVYILNNSELVGPIFS